MFAASRCLALFFMFPLLAGGQERAVLDDQGVAFPLSAPPERIISLAPNITEILFALGLDERIVGVTRYCDYPPAALKKKIIGGMIDPSPEMVKSLTPDLIIAFRGNPLRMIDRLRDLRLPVFVLNTGNSLESLVPLIARIGRITDKESAAAELSANFLGRLAAVREKLRTVSARPRTYLTLHGSEFWTCGRDSYLNDLLFNAGAANVTAAIPKNWLHYSLEQIIRDDPEVIIIMAKSLAEFQQAAGLIRHDKRLQKIQALQRNRIGYLDENIAGRFGPRLAQALEDTARCIHPESFGEYP